MTVSSLEKIQILFIVGSPRSGTTLLKDIFDSRADSVVPPENDFLLFQASDYARKNKWNKSDKKNFFENLWFDKKNSIKTWGINKLTLEHDLENIPEEISYLNLCKLVYLNVFKLDFKTEIKYIIDKNPLYTIHIDKILKLKPDAKIICIVRDYRDNVASRKKHKLEIINRVGFIAASWIKYNKAILKFQKTHPNNIYVLKYEDLVSNPEIEIKALCKFSNIPFEQGMLNPSDKKGKLVRSGFEKEKNSEIEQRYNAMHENTLKPISANYSNQWEKHLTEQEIKICEFRCDEMGTKFNYEATKELSISEMFYIPILATSYSFIYNVFINSFSFFFGLPLSIKLMVYKLIGMKKI